ncbi:Uncharacterized protein OBRU01_07866 [Operophtera brumata]|uniref:Uncharacterized protein n=1 Tax=Operophtera brumata TaxID=104452 RepID=A0A0L7LJK9_OPEBR|nr:Uncharacterized protein OBRU01_07866 [Operophtera brumata]
MRSEHAAIIALSKSYSQFLDADAVIVMRSEHAAIIALSKSHSQFLDADAVIVYDQRTAL